MDRFGGVQVSESDSIRNLHFDNEIIQSSVSVTEPASPVLEYIRGMSLILRGPGEVENVLILGLGGGSLVNVVHRHFPGAYIDGVERSQAVCDAAHAAMFLPESDTISIEVCDAMEFLKLARWKPVYDLVFLDLFDADGPALEYLDLEFSMLLGGVMRPGGRLAVNLWKSARSLTGSFIENIEMSLGETGIKWVLPSGLNLVYFTVKSPRPDNFFPGWRYESLDREVDGGGNPEPLFSGSRELMRHLVDSFPYQFETLSEA